jgi:hypothetical protein
MMLKMREPSAIFQGALGSKTKRNTPLGGCNDALAIYTTDDWRATAQNS